MYYTPAVVVPGNVAHTTLNRAQHSAMADATYVMDEDFNIIEDYRGLIIFDVLGMERP